MAAVRPQEGASLSAYDDAALLEAVAAQDVAVEFDRRAAAGARVQAVDVLRHERDAHRPMLEAGECQVPGVRFSAAHGVAAPRIPAPHEPRVAREALRGEASCSGS